MNNAFVKVLGVEDKKDKLTTTFGTMEGHIEKGKITFRLQENKDGSIKFSIDSQSEVDMGIAPEGFSRDQQKQSWKEVLGNITKYLGGEETKREVKKNRTKKERIMMFYFYSILIPFLILAIGFYLEGKPKRKLKVVNYLFKMFLALALYTLLIYFLETEHYINSSWTFYTILFFLIPFGLIVTVFKLYYLFKNKG